MNLALSDPRVVENLRWSREKARCEQDFRYLASEYLRIKAKNVIGFPKLRFNPVQAHLLGKMEDQWKRTGWIRQCWGKARQVGACVHPNTRILKENLTWNSIDDIEIGDVLVATDENPPGGKGRGRKLRRSTVVDKRDVFEPAFVLLLDNGERLIATGDHRFLSGVFALRRTRREMRGAPYPQPVGTRWKHVRDFRIGDPIRFVMHPWSPGSFEDGWMGGILDGEGSCRTTAQRTGAEVTIAQAPGTVCDQIQNYLKTRGYTFHVYVDDRTPENSGKFGFNIVNKVVVTRMADVFRLLGKTRPHRFMTRDWWEGKDIPGRGWGIRTAWPRVVSIAPLGLQRMIDLQTTTATFIAEGFVSHNSTLGRGMTLHQTAFKDDRNAFLLTHDEPTSYELFDIDQTFYDALPKPLQPVTKHRSKTRMNFSGRNSKILIGHARNANVGASQMNHVWHLTELARYPNPEEIQASLFPSFSAATGVNCSIGLLESTSRFGGDWWKDFWESSRRGETDYEAHFIPWSMHPDYSSTVPKGFQPTLEEKDLIRRYALTMGNVVWRRAKKAEYRTNPALFLQEYPLTWEESWQLPKGTLRVFDEITVTRIARGIVPGQRMNVESSGLKESMGGVVEVWEPPQPGVFYHVGVDISEGRNSDADWTVLEVLRRDTLEQVAECRLRVDPASPPFLDLVYWMGCAYNMAEINPDITGGWGVALMSELQRRSYPNLWRWRRRDDDRQRVSTRVGFLFTPRDKKYLVSNAVLLAVAGKVVIHSETLKDEMRDYLNIGLDEWGAAPGSFDDTVSAWMLALLAARDEQTEYVETKAEAEKPKPPAYLVHDVQADLQSDQEMAVLDMRPWR